MKLLSLSDIKKLGPCYDPAKYLSEDWKGTVLDILDLKQVPFRDRFWVIMRWKFVSDKLMRLFAVKCARQVQHLMKDERSLKALNVAERFANGEATEEELRAACDAAYGAAWAAWDAAGAAWNAARYSASDAAWDSSCDAAWDFTGAKRETILREVLIAGIETGDVK